MTPTSSQFGQMTEQDTDQSANTPGREGAFTFKLKMFSLAPAQFRLCGSFFRTGSMKKSAQELTITQNRILSPLPLRSPSSGLSARWYFDRRPCPNHEGPRHHQTPHCMSFLTLTSIRNGDGRSRRPSANIC